MKKQSLVNLVKYHVEKNDEAFAIEAAEIAKEFDAAGDSAVAQYLMELVSNVNFYVPQSNYHNLHFLRKVGYSTQPLMLPDAIEEDIIGITKAISSKKSGLSKFLFFGAPGSGKTESVYQIARLLNRDILTVSFEQLIDSRLGETAKNVSLLFDEIDRLPYGKVIVLFDEIDALVLDRINKNDLREMGRVTSVFLKEIEQINGNIPIIATTNLIANFDKAILRRFDAVVSFDRYSKDDLISVADSILTSYLKRATNSKQDIRLFNKILKNLDDIPFPGDLKQVIKTSIAFSDESNEYDYLRRIYLSLNGNPSIIDIQKLRDEGYTTREIEILSRMPKSSVSRKLRG
ncbi:ATP-binding protein [uncultured Cloacibacillus sp.]|uniref:ATP-binding protein n=1 Tax=uncultured Cloacibacillus sp. TaxID=889794 RepID=UPI0026DBF82B|nr:ATP-binding protein [uncultured Cloacibacillus sp.]